MRFGFAWCPSRKVFQNFRPSGHPCPFSAVMTALQDAISILVAHGYLGATDRQSLRSTCRDLRCLVSRHTKQLIIDDRVHPEALQASGLLHKGLEHVNIDLRWPWTRPGTNQPDMALLLTLAAMIIDTCSATLQELTITLLDEQEDANPSLHPHLFSVCHLIAANTWPKLRALYCREGGFLMGILFPAGAGSRYSRLMTLHTCLTVETVDTMAAACCLPQLRVLELVNADAVVGIAVRMTDSMVLKVLQAAPCLESLSLVEFPALNCLGVLPLAELSRLHISSNSWIVPDANWTSYCSFLFMRPWPKLMELHLSLTTIKDQDVFEFRNILGTSADGFFPCLTALVLNCTVVHWATISDLSLTGLRSLRVSCILSSEGVPLQPDAAILTAFSTLPNLREFDWGIRDTSTWKADLMALLATECMPHVTILTLSFQKWPYRPMSADADIVIAIAKVCVRLRALNISRTSLEFGRAALGMLRGCGSFGALPLLKEIGIEGAEGMTDKLREVWPELICTDEYYARVWRNEEYLHMD